MITYSTISGLIVAYLLGSMATAVWIGKIFYKVDVREYGSGNAGATNTFRVLGKGPGSAVMLLDCLKGYLATNVAWVITVYEPGSIQFVNYQLAMGIAAVVGHIFPIYAGFRGGKGIATLMGMMLALHPEAAGLCLLVFLITLAISKYVSLGSIVASITFPFLAFFVFPETPSSLRVFGIAIALLVVTTHQKNIERIMSGEESKVRFFGGSKSKKED